MFGGSYCSKEEEGGRKGEDENAKVSYFSPAFSSGSVSSCCLLTCDLCSVWVVELFSLAVLWSAAVVKLEEEEGAATTPKCTKKHEKPFAGFL